MAKRMISRRRFVQGALAAGTAYSLIPGRAMGANERVNIGVIGVGGQGGGHLKRFGGLDGVEVIAVSDPDMTHMDKAKGNAAKHQDLRKLLDMKDIDAVVIAAPDHWHCLAAVMAMQAGKHVYVEKPVSQCIWEGRKMVEAARKYNKVVQAGTQQRSCPAVQECAADVQAGKYGKVIWAHTSRLGAREPIGLVTEPLKIPDFIDYNLWAGPAPMTPVMRQEFHYDWHWQWNWGTGEMGNWAIHYVDDLRHILGWDDVPTNVISAGNRWWDDNGETPNMHLALMEHRGVKVVVDIRNMKDPAGRGGSGGAVYLGSRGGNYIKCENGYISISRGGGKAYDNDGKEVKQYKGDGGSAHAGNFINAVRENSNKSLACEIEVGHQSTMMCHLANISYRLGNAGPVDALRADLKSCEDAVNTLEDMIRQVEGCEVDLKKKPFNVGPKLSFNNKTERFEGENSDGANAFLRLDRRPEFPFPAQV